MIEWCTYRTSQVLELMREIREEDDMGEDGEFTDTSGEADPTVGQAHPSANSPFKQRSSYLQRSG